MTASIKDQVDLLMQGTEYGDICLRNRMASELEERLCEAHAEGRALRVYCGFDPRTKDLHLGHTVPIGKLRQFQELGHEIFFVVGTGTALIGDPSDKTGLRPVLSEEAAVDNGKTYAEQAFRLLDREKTSVLFNHEWLIGLSFRDLLNLASRFSLQQFLGRDNFRLRWEKGDPVYLHETFYSLMQGYDAYHLKADVQVGGTDQLFNIVTASRKIMEGLGMRPNIAVIVGILPGTDGKVKMSKSLGNAIPILAAPPDMYGNLMSIPDEAMRTYFEKITPLGPRDIERIFADLASGKSHPRDVKMRLAHEVVAVMHSPGEADEAAEEFDRVFRRSEAPSGISVCRVKGPRTVVELLVLSGLASSKSEARRLVVQNGVKMDGRTVSDPCEPIPMEGMLQAGRRRFIRFQVE